MGAGGLLARDDAVFTDWKFLCLFCGKGQALVSTASSLNLFFLHCVELGGVFNVGWDFPPNAINALFPLGPRDTGRVGQHLLVVCV